MRSSVRSFMQLQLTFMVLALCHGQDVNTQPSISPPSSGTSSSTPLSSSTLYSMSVSATASSTAFPSTATGDTAAVTSSTDLVEEDTSGALGIVGGPDGMAYGSMQSSNTGAPSDGPSDSASGSSQTDSMEQSAESSTAHNSTYATSTTASISATGEMWSSSSETDVIRSTSSLTESSSAYSSTYVTSTTESMSITGEMSPSSSETDVIGSTPSSVASSSIFMTLNPSSSTGITATTTGNVSISHSSTEPMRDSSTSYISSSEVSMTSLTTTTTTSSIDLSLPSVDLTDVPINTTASSSLHENAETNPSTVLPFPSMTVNVSSSVIVDAPLTSSNMDVTTSHSMSSSIASMPVVSSSSDTSSTYSSTVTNSALPSTVTSSMSTMSSSQSTDIMSTTIMGSSVAEPDLTSSSVSSTMISSTTENDATHTISSTPSLPPLSSTTSSFSSQSTTADITTTVPSTVASSIVETDATRTISSTPPLPPLSSTSSSFSSQSTTVDMTTTVPVTVVSSTVMTDTTPTLSSAPTLPPLTSTTPSSSSQSPSFDGTSISLSTESSTPTMTMTTLPPTTSEVDMVNTSMSLVFDGDCTVLMENDNHMSSFKSILCDKLMAATGMDATRIIINDVRCGSVKVSVMFYDTSDTVVLDSIVAMAESGDLSLSISSSNGPYNYTSVSGTIEEAPVPVGESGSSGWVTWSELDTVEKIIIIVTICIVACLMLCTFCVLICRCHRRKHTKSFTLQETPPDNYHTQDFTLTKMDRPQPLYTEDGIVMPMVETNGHGNGVVKVGYENELYDVNEAGDEKNSMYTANPAYSDTEAEPIYDTADIIRSPSTERLMTASHRNNDGGYDNPSFSSDDILDSGTEADATDGDYSQDELGSEPPLVEISTAVCVSVPDPFSAASSDSGMAAAGSSNAASPSTSDTRAAAIEVEPLSQCSDANDSLNSSTAPEIEEELEPVPQVTVSVFVPDVITEEQPAESPEPDSSDISDMPPSPAKPSYENVPDDLPAPPLCALESTGLVKGSQYEAADEGTSDDAVENIDNAEDLSPPADPLPVTSELVADPQEIQVVPTSGNPLNNVPEAGEQPPGKGEEGDSGDHPEGGSATSDKHCDDININRTTDFEELATEL